jgi:hypothetical protein
LKSSKNEEKTINLSLTYGSVQDYPLILQFFLLMLEFFVEADLRCRRVIRSLYILFKYPSVITASLNGIFDHLCKTNIDHGKVGRPKDAVDE